MNESPSPEHVVILGGGVAGCMAAYWLTHPEQQGKYRVTLYQNGWRLGGKGASSRSGPGHRSEEHGPHVWFGFYENAFRTLRGCIEEHAALGQSLGDYTTWEHLFKASTEGVFFYKDPANEWHRWKIELDRYGGTPGDGNPSPRIQRMLWRIADQIEANIGPGSDFWPAVPWFVKLASWILGRKVQTPDPGGINPGDPKGWASHLAARLVALADDEKHPLGERGMGRLLKFMLDQAGKLIRLKASDPNLSVVDREVLCLADLHRTCFRGALVDLLLDDKKFRDLDPEEFQDWLARHGAAFPQLKDSPYLRGYYDTAFAFTGGGAHNSSTANMAAGAALRGFFRIFFGYKGAYAYRMTLGMGECVFVPLYRVLKARGVKFEFFHRVEKLMPDASGKRVARIELDRQVRLREGRTEYEPLTEVEVTEPGKKPIVWPVWPDKPLENQLDPTSLPPADDPGLESHWSVHRGETVVLADGVDFDRVILAIPPEAHPRLAAGLLEKSEPYRRMVENSESIRTIACQFWFKGVPEYQPTPEDEPVLGGAAPDPLNILIEATPILRSESTAEAKHVFYLCGPARNDPQQPPYGSDPDYPQRMKLHVKKACVTWLEEFAPLCLPGTSSFDPMTLYHPDPEATAEQRIDWQYYRINIDPSERYVLSTNTSMAHRLAPSESGFENLVFAGDWCRNSIDIGCVESATTSAMLAVKHLTGFPTADMIEGQQYE